MGSLFSMNVLNIFAIFHKHYIASFGMLAKDGWMDGRTCTYDLIQ